MRALGAAGEAVALALVLACCGAHAVHVAVSGGAPALVVPVDYVPARRLYDYDAGPP